MSKARWDDYLATVREKYEEIDSAERYKEEDLAEALTSARTASPASASPAKSVVVEPGTLPVELPTPRPS